MRSEEFFAYARERERIRRSRLAGQPAPWTEDPVLQKYRFCNINREHDRVTAWFRHHLRDPLRDDPFVLLATVAFRWFNLPVTGMALKPMLLERRWDAQEAVERIRESRPNGPWTTGAYMIKSRIGHPKVEGLCWCIDNIAQDAEHLAARVEPGDTTLEGMWERLCEYPYMGAFMAYEVVTDLRHTYLLQDAPDIDTWANPGPGAARGLCRLLGKPLDALNRNRDPDRATMIALMQELLDHSRTEANWPQDWFQWELREVEHTLCEFDKYERARLGEGRPKQQFHPTP